MFDGTVLDEPFVLLVAITSDIKSRSHLGKQSRPKEQGIA
jgi:hypothetical protein